VYRALFDELFCAAIRKREPQLPAVDPGLSVDAHRYVGDYENIQSRISIEANRGALRASVTPRGDMGVAMKDLPLAFVDRQTAITQTGNPQIDRMPLLVSDALDGRFTFVQTGLRQYRRV